MEVVLTPDEEAFINAAVASGRLSRPEEAMNQALSMWEERERRRVEILASIQRSEEQFARGEYRVVSTEEESRQFVEDVKRRGRALLAAEQRQG